VQLGGGREVLLSDTVGFVRRLPHSLVESFHSTLAEVQDADFLLLVANAADIELDDKMTSVRRVLEELGVAEKPQILVLNQSDLVDEDRRADLRFRYPDATWTSALTGEGLDDLRAEILRLLEADDKEFEFTLDAGLPETGRILAEIARRGRVLEETVMPGGNGAHPQLRVRALLSPRWREVIFRETT
jgi:GTP-binding protein HflX